MLLFCGDYGLCFPKHKSLSKGRDNNGMFPPIGKHSMAMRSELDVWLSQFIAGRILRTRLKERPVNVNVSKQ